MNDALFFKKWMENYKAIKKSCSHIKYQVKSVIATKMKLMK